jgi:hypothetical protein
MYTFAPLEFFICTEVDVVVTLLLAKQDENREVQQEEENPA